MYEIAIGHQCDCARVLAMLKRWMLDTASSDSAHKVAPPGVDLALRDPAMVSSIHAKALISQ